MEQLTMMKICEDLENSASRRIEEFLKKPYIN
jgi:hypothetical protein